METRQVITDKVIDDILCTAFEGGSTYWCPTGVVIVSAPDDTVGMSASDLVSRGGLLAIADDREQTGDARKFEWRPLDRERIEQGIRRAARFLTEDVRTFHEEHDAVAADIALQFAIFGEVIYG
jgi:hypothetical protein